MSIERLYRVLEDVQETTAELTETFESVERATESKFDEEAAVLRNVPVNGGKSKNGLDYSRALEHAAKAKVYENVDIFLNHRKPGEARKVEEKFGSLRNVRVIEGKGLYGDVHYNPKHPFAEAFGWWAKNNPSAIGLSHDAIVRKSNPTARVVEEIVKVDSVDIVHEPATTAAIQEGVIQDDMRKRRLPGTIETVHMLMNQVMWPMQEMTEKEKIEKLLEIAKDFRKELNSMLGDSVTESHHKEDEMDFSKITLEDLKAKAPHLIDAAVKEHVTHQNQIQESVNAIFDGVDAKFKTDVLVQRVTEAVEKGYVDLAKTLVETFKNIPAPTSPAPASFGTQSVTEQKKPETKKAASFDSVLADLNK